MLHTVVYHTTSYHRYITVAMDTREDVITRWYDDQLQPSECVLIIY